MPPAPHVPARTTLTRSTAMLVSGVAIFGLAACGAMSENDYRKLAASVGRRNDERVRAAKAGLERQGYVFVEDDRLRSAELDDETRERCLARSDEPAARVTVSAPARGGVPHEAPLEVSAPMTEACAFFGERSASLDVTRSDGTRGRLLRIAGPRWLARTPDGEVVQVDMRSRDISKQRVLVDRTCNLMPRPDLSPLEAGPARLLVVWHAPPLRTITLSFDRELVEVECTETVE